MDNSFNSPTLKNNISAVVYIFMAIIAFIVAYPLYTLIHLLPNQSGIVSVTIFLCWWIACFMVIWMGTIYTLQGKQNG